MKVQVGRKCVRCGLGPQLERAYICLVCAQDPAQIREVDEARAQREIPARRYVRLKYGWYGGWPRDDFTRSGASDD